MGEVFALSCALAWALAVILFRKSGETVPPLALNLFRVSISSILFALTLVVMRQPLLGQAPWQDYLILAASGIIAIAISDTLFHMCLNRVGAGVNAIVDTFYSPLILLFAVFMLGEKLVPAQIGGMALIMSAVLVATQVQPPEGTPRKTLIAGIGYGIAAMGSLAFGIVLAKPVLETSNILWATTIRQFGSLLVLVPICLLHPRRKIMFSTLKPQKSWKFSLPGTVLGSYLALLMWIGGMKYIPAGKAAILNQTSTIYILIFASLFLKEKFTKRKLVSVILALSGVLLVLGAF